MVLSASGLPVKTPNLLQSGLGDALSDQLDVVERLLQIHQEGQRSSTYKLAVLIGLLDLCL